MTKGLPLREVAFLHSADDAAFDYDSSRRTAAAQLLSGAYQGAGLFVLTGEAGIGKSSLLRSLFRQVASLDGVVPLPPSGPLICRRGMTLAQVLAACEPRLQLGEAADDSLKLARRLQRFAEDGSVPVLIADDADLLADPALESLATLAGLQTGQRRLLSVILAGTPALSARLALPSEEDATADSGRIVTLQPLTDTGVARLLQRRLSAAFERDAVSLIAEAAGGIPAQVITLGERALWLASLRSSTTVTREIAAVAAGIETDPAGGLSENESASVGDAASPVTASFGSSEETPPLAEPASAPPAASAPGSAPEFPSVPPSAAPGEAPGEVPGEKSGELPGTGAFGSTPGTPFGISASEPPVGVRTTRLVPSRRRSAARSGTLAIAGGVCFAVLLAVGSSLYTSEQPARRGTGPLSSQGTPAPGLATSNASGSGTSGIGPSTSGDAASLADAQANDTEAGQAGRRWRPPSWEEPSLANRAEGTGGPEVPASPAPDANTAAAVPEKPEATAPAWDTDADAWASRTPARPPVRALTGPLAGTSSNGGSAEQRVAPASAAAQPRTQAASSAQRAEHAADLAVATPEEPEPGPEKAAAERSAARSAAKSASSARAGAPAAGEPLAALPSRKRQIAALLDDGDALLEGGDVEAARASYENAFERGSGEAARRLAETFDPRSQSPASRQASPEEAILWYKDAARKGDRRAAAELTELESWLESSAASGNREARRVLDAWRKPAEPEAEGEAGPDAAATP